MTRVVIEVGCGAAAIWAVVDANRARPVGLSRVVLCGVAGLFIAERFIAVAEIMRGLP